MSSTIQDITLNPSQDYNSKDIDLINFVELKRRFGLPEDYIELHTYDLNNNLLKSNYNYLGYRSLLSSLPSPSNLIDTLNVDPNQDSINEGYNYGSNILSYNIFRKLFASDINNKFFIKTISTDRTELRIACNNLSNDNLQNLYTNFIVSSTQEAFYKDFFLNFGNNNIIIGINIVLEQDISQYNLLVKLYEPLPNNFTIKDQFWIIDKLSDPISYQIDFEVINTTISSSIPTLRGPNFNIKVNNEINPSINYINYNNFFSTTSTSSYQQLKSILEEKSLDINIDYTDYSNFIHFSSAKERLLNFIYKLKLIENYNGDLKTLNNSINTPQISSSKAIINSNINNIIEKFDGYEYYLYYNSGSKAFPKKNNFLPYLNFETTSSQALIWLGDDNSKSGLYGGQLYSSSYYDENNQDNLLYTIPEYLRIDSQNQPYELFIHMIGQHFDNVWLYSKGTTDLYNAENNVDKGISKDLVSYALKSLGIKLYSNTNVDSNIFNYLLGTTRSGSYLPSTGSEVITTFVTMSLSSSTLPGAEIDKEIYKRIYHNLPYLLKTKGTERGLRALITCYGIPDTILHINEFGGTDKTSTNFEQYYDRTSYALNTKTGSVYVTTPWAPVYIQSISQSNINAVPDTVEFRFKTNGPPVGNQLSLFTSQSLFQVSSGSAIQFGVQLLFTSQSNSGTFANYGDLKLIISGSGNYSSSLPIHLPFFNDDWWNVMVYRETGSLSSSSISNNNKYWIYAANSIYGGHDGETIGFIGSSSIFISSSTPSYNRAWNLYDTSSFTSYLGGADSNNVIASGSTRFNGFFQELRYWINPLPLDNFKAHVLNPLSIENTDVTSSYSKLIFRLPLGTDLNVTGSSITPSVHPSYTGKPSTGSFLVGGSQISYGNIFSPGFSLYGVAIYGQDVYVGAGTDVVYTSNTSFYYLKSGNMGLTKPTNDKIRIDSQEIASGSILSPFTKLEQNHQIALTKDVNTLEVAFSPQDQINNDIIYQLGYYDIDNYIGDPREGTSSRYDNLRSLRNFYFQKYINSYNIFDFMRLIKYYNNSLFKMIKDFIPARSNISTGIIIKPHILERPKHKRFEPILSNTQYSQSIKVEKFAGENGKALNPTSSTTYTSYASTVSGSVAILNDKKWEMFTGRLSGSRLTISSQKLQKGNFYTSRSGSFDLNTFYHSPFNILLNNVSHSKKSTKFFAVDYTTNQILATNLNNIISGASFNLSRVQESNYSLKSFTHIRYRGSRTTSQFYNIYTDGDKSYGKTAAIDKNTLKVGLFTAISSSIFLPNRQEARLKYLVDQSGSLIELNQQNNNWFEVQNTFKQGNVSTIALFDNQKYGNQKSTEGSKSIYSSGYDYQPLLYFSSSDNQLYFQYSGNSVSKLFRVTNISGSYISGSATSSYAVTGSKVFNLFDQLDGNFSDGNVYYTIGSYTGNTFPTYSVPETNLYAFSSSFSVGWQVPTSSLSGSFKFNIKNNGVSIASQSLSFTSSVLGYTQSYWEGIGGGYNGKTITCDSNISSYLNSFTSSNIIQFISASSIINVPSGSIIWYLSGSSPILGTNVTYITSTGSLQTLLPGVTSAFSASSDHIFSSSGYLYTINGIDVTNHVGNALNLSNTLNFSIASLYTTLIPGDKVTFEFTVGNDFNTNNWTASVSDGELKNLIQTNAGIYPYATNSISPFISGSISSNTLILNTSLSSFRGYTYIPGTGSNALYSKYGNINYDSMISNFDTILIKYFDTTVGTMRTIEYSIANTYTLAGQYYIVLSGLLPNSLNKGAYSSSDFSELLLLKRLRDETLVIFNFNKIDGQTSYGFVIPNDIHKKVLDNIDTITRQVKTKLLEINATT